MHHVSGSKWKVLVNTNLILTFLLCWRCSMFADNRLSTSYIQHVRLNSSWLICCSWMVLFHLQQVFFLMGWAAVRVTVVSLTLSSCSINTLTQKKKKKKDNFLQKSSHLIIFHICFRFLILGIFSFIMHHLTWPGESETLSRSCQCRRWLHRTSCYFPTSNMHPKASQTYWQT